MKDRFRIIFIQFTCPSDVSFFITYYIKSLEGTIIIKRGWKSLLKYIFGDWKVNDSFISRIVISTYRFGNWSFYKFKIPVIRQLLLVLYKILDLLIVKTVAGADIPHKCKIGKRIYIAHGANGVVIHPNAILGDDIRIYHQVTIGSAGFGNNKAPVLNNRVFVGVGARVLGEIILGQGSRVGANAVLMESLQEDIAAVGIPAKPYLKNRNANNL